MKILSPLDRAAFSELIDLCRIDAEKAVSPYKLNGSFLAEARNRGNDLYWYYRGYDRTIDGSPGKPTKSYVGPVGNEEIDAIAADHEARRESYLTRRHLVSRLKRAGLPSPDRMEGAIVAALVEAGLVGSGATIVGSAAFQTYGGLLGIRPKAGEYQTKDIDIAQPRGLRIEPGAENSTDVLEALKTADASFEPYFLSGEPRLVLGFKNREGFRVEFLTPKAADRNGAKILRAVAGVPGIGAQQLKFLEFSLIDTVSSVMLHEAGVLVPVPDPARFAIHKLVVASIRSVTDAGQGLKALKYVLQAQLVIDGFALVRDTARLGGVWLEAWDCGPRWRKSLRDGTLRLDPQRLATLADAVTEAAIASGRTSPFEGDLEPRSALVAASLRSKSQKAPAGPRREA